MELCYCFQCKIDGLIVSNTTIARPDSLMSQHKSEAGGLSGKPLKNIADETLKDVYALTQGNNDKTSKNLLFLSSLLLGDFSSKNTT